jgi:hypothetical protein
MRCILHLYASGSFHPDRRLNLGFLVVMETTMSFRCSLCRLSNSCAARLRPGDIWRLMVFQYPVRCRICGTRGYTWAPRAFFFHQQHKQNERLMRLKAASRLSNLPLEGESSLLPNADQPPEWFSRGQTRPMMVSHALSSGIMASATYWSQRFGFRGSKSSGYL